MPEGNLRFSFVRSTSRPNYRHTLLSDSLVDRRIGEWENNNMTYSSATRPHATPSSAARILWTIHTANRTGVTFHCNRYLPGFKTFMFDVIKVVADTLKMMHYCVRHVFIRHTPGKLQAGVGTVRVCR